MFIYMIYNVYVTYIYTYILLYRLYVYTYNREMFYISMYQQVGHGTSQSVLRRLFVSFVELGQGFLLPRGDHRMLWLNQVESPWFLPKNSVEQWALKSNQSNSSVSKPCTPGEHQNSWSMDVHPTKNGINRYWSIPKYQLAPKTCPKLLETEAIRIGSNMVHYKANIPMKLLADEPHCKKTQIEIDTWPNMAPLSSSKRTNTFEIQMQKQATNKCRKHK